VSNQVFSHPIIGSTKEIIFARSKAKSFANRPKIRKIAKRNRKNSSNILCLNIVKAKQNDDKMRSKKYSRLKLNRTTSKESIDKIKPKKAIVSYISKPKNGLYGQRMNLQTKGRGNG